MQHQIRIANLPDAAALSEFARRTYSAAFGQTFVPSDLAAHLERGLSLERVARFITDDVVLLAERDGLIIGYVQFGAAPSSVGIDSSGAQELRRLYVDGACQGQGIGASLMDATLAHPLLQRAENIYLEVWEHNTGAQRFYVRYGFKVIGSRPFAVESGRETSHELLMVRQSKVVQSV